MDAILRDLVWACRVARRSPVITAMMTLTLAFAIGATVTVFSIVDAWLLRPLHFPNPDRLVIALGAARERPSEPAIFLLYRTYVAWKERSRSFDLVSAVFRRSYLVTGRGHASTLLGLAVTEEFFATLGVPAARGRTLSSRDAAGPPATVLSHGLWQRQFGGSADAIGTHVTLNGVPHEVVGVMPHDFDVRMLDQERGFELWTLLDARDPGYGPGGAGPVAIIGRLRESITPAAAQAELDAIHNETESGYADNAKRFLVVVTSLQADNTRTVRATLVTVTGAVACLLFVACINVGAVQLGRGIGRGREAAIRAAIGSGRRRLVQQFLTESVLLSVAGGAIGLALALVAMRVFAAWNPIGTLPPGQIRIDVRVFVFSLALTTVAAIACGLLPALRVASADSMDALRAGGSGGTEGAPAQRSQMLLVAGQMALSVMLLVATTLLVRTLIRLQGEPLGFEPSNLTVVSVALPTDEFDSSAKRNNFYRGLAARIAGLAGVGRIAAGTMPPLHGGPPVSVRRSGNDVDEAVRVSAQEVTPEFFETLEIVVVAGRVFKETDSAAAPGVAVVNESAARAIFGSIAGAVGQVIRVGSEPREVIGIVGNTRGVFFNTLEWVTNPILYLPAAQAFSAPRDPTVRSFGFHLHVRSARPIGMAELKAAVASLSSGVAVVEVTSGRESLAKATRQPAFRVVLLGWFGAASLLLAAIGVYGLVSQGVAHRRREIGVRLALGAEATHVIKVVAGRALLAGVGGAVCGSIAALGLGTRMQALLYGVRATDTLSFASAAAVLMAVTAAAALVPAVRATRINPTDVLRGD